MKTLIAAALLSAAFAVPAVPAVAADALETETGVETVCFFLPLLPDCLAQWEAEWEANGFHFVALPVAWWTCEMAEKGSGHLLDCES